MTRLRPWAGRGLLLVLGVCAAAVLLELLLRVHNPFGFRIRGDRIVPPVYARYTIRNLEVVGLDRDIVHTKNSLGFRGPEPPDDFDRHLTIAAVGGSTTECYFLADGRDWPAQLGRRLSQQFRDVWVNNAGLDGNSTYGHIVLVQDYLRRLRPKMAIFLVGRNELYNTEGQPLDARFLRRPPNVRSPHDAVRFAASYSEVVSVSYNLLYRYAKARRIDLVHRPQTDGPFDATAVDVPPQKQRSLSVPDEDRQAILASHAESLAAYARRLQQLIAVTRDAGIHPVFVTQPLMFGPTVDEDTGVDLGAVYVAPKINGALAWETQERYNDVLREVSAREGVDLIDLARVMPKRTRYYYDAAHFTNDGSERVAELLAPETARILSMRWSEYRK